MPDIDRIVAYHKFEIDRSLLLYRYAALTARAEPLTLEEGTALGIETTLKIFRAEKSPVLLLVQMVVETPAPVTLPAEEMQSLILDVFEIPEDHQRRERRGSQSSSSSFEATRDPNQRIDSEVLSIYSSKGTSSPYAPPLKQTKPAWGNASTANKPANTAAKTTNATNAWGPKTTGKSTNAQGDKPADENTTPSADNSPESARAEKDAAAADKDAKASTGGLVIHSDTQCISDFSNSPSIFPESTTDTTSGDDTTATEPPASATAPNTKHLDNPRSPTPTGGRKKGAAHDLDIEKAMIVMNEHDDEFHDIHTTETDENYETWKNDAVNDDGAVEPLGDIRRDEASLVVDSASTVSSGQAAGLASSSTGVSVVAFPDSPETIICLPADTSIDPLTPVTEEEAPGATDDTDQKALEDSLEAQSVNSSSEDFTIEVDMAEPSSSEPVSDDVTDAQAFEGGYHESFLPDDAESEITADLGLSPEAVLSKKLTVMEVTSAKMMLSETPATVWQAITDEPGQIANESFPSPSEFESGKSTLSQDKLTALEGETETYNESKTTATAEEDPEPSSDLPSVSFGDDTSVPAATGSQTVDETWFDQSDTNPSYDSQPDSATPLEKETESADGADPWQLDATEENEAVAPAVDDPGFDQSDTNPSYDSRPDPVPPVENETENATAEDEVAAPFTNDGDSNSANTPASQDVDQTLPESALTSDAPSNTDDGNSSPIEQDELHDAPGPVSISPLQLSRNTPP
ncbi:hypothetical protein BDP27DRAFT_1431181 [Rhodocollybia butyracea]|uniref:Uncharacterized protein n=1 Tax=Rhodocollybia butyracea TaxID=206335 RepID=A0A9P5P652_9AGAR|nr:hypothetical protein BDP27DRAFT_1431181 [Rhodocollybia butyracea]